MASLVKGIYVFMIERGKWVMKMDKKMKECFTPHVLMHSLFGLGLGVVLTTLVPSLQMVWLGVLLIVVSIALDVTRK